MFCVKIDKLNFSQLIHVRWSYYNIIIIINSNSQTYNSLLLSHIDQQWHSQWNVNCKQISWLFRWETKFLAKFHWKSVEKTKFLCRNDSFDWFWLFLDLLLLLFLHFSSLFFTKIMVIQNNLLHLTKWITKAFPLLCISKIV